MLVEIELIENLFKKSKIETITMQRVNAMGRRMYATRNPFKMYSGITGALGSATFSGNIEKKRLNKWRDKMINHLGSIEKQEAYLGSMADFGTLTHECIVRVWEQGNIDFDSENEYAENFFIQSAKKNNIEVNMEVVQAQVYEYGKSVASLMQFLHAEVEELYCVESMCYSEELIIATPVDIVCKLKNGKTATINIKTSSAIGDHQREQVAVEKYLWNLTYPNCQAEITGIIRPKDWSEKKGVPTYELEFLKPEQEHLLLNSALNRLRLCLNDENSTYANFPNNIPTFTGVCAMGDMPRIEYKTMEEYLKDGLIADKQYQLHAVEIALDM